MLPRVSKIPWPSLVPRVRLQKVTPFLGAGISRPWIPGAADLAGLLAAEYEKAWGEPYPFKSHELMHVAQYWAIKGDNQDPKLAVRDILAGLEPPTYAPEQAHCQLAALKCPVYITTNYDDFMEEALRRAGRTPITEICRWSSRLTGLPSHLLEHEPDVGNPVVFHVHGHVSIPESMLLTEDDYLDFMVNVRRVTTSETSLLVLPPKIDELLTQTSLLFLGYGLRDWNLRVLLRGLVENADRSAKYKGVSVQVEPNEEEVDQSRLDIAVEYLEQYFKGPNLDVFWGTADDFLKEIGTRLAAPVAA